MSQRFGLYTDLTVAANLAFYADLYQVPRAERPARLERLFAFSNLGPFRRRLAGKLSGGMKQKLGLCCALIHEADPARALRPGADRRGGHRLPRRSRALRSRRPARPRPRPRARPPGGAEELASRNSIVPGLVAVVMMMMMMMMIIAAMLTSLTIAREWERGTMELLAATPVARVEVVLGKLLPYLGIGLADVAVATLLGVFLFRVPLRGSPALLMTLSFFFLAAGLGLAVRILQKRIG